ncbi:unnamed protein product [Spirodela intermedia]|uniref:Uncharacterized protein n=1 Tax=Spirodela intermedia TaxID=51605 RepID=A0A7I8JMP4_SPIIN|nr:unnamed protein product [Spirodela intermedia]CAA6670732.1 unnamed protein product [Spirodela intermedia]
MVNIMINQVVKFWLEIIKCSPRKYSTQCNKMHPGPQAGRKLSRGVAASRGLSVVVHLDGVRRVLGSFILRSAQQEEALHRIWYALRRE